MGNLSARTGFTPVQLQVTLANNATTSVQDFAAYDSQELTGFVYADGTADYRAAVKVTVLKDGSGTYQIASADVSGDDVSSAALVTFSMSGSILQATLASITGYVTAYIKYNLNSLVLGTAGYFTNPMTLTGDMVYGGASGLVTRLAGNTTTTRKFFRQTGDGSNSAAPVWDTLQTGDIPSLTTTRGDIVKRGASADERLAIGSANTVLKTDGTDPSWGLIANANVDNSAAIAGSKINPDFGSQNIATTGSLSSNAGQSFSASNAGSIVTVIEQSNTSNSVAALYVRKARSDGTTNDFIRFFVNTSTDAGAIKANSGTPAFVAASDRRIKTNIETLQGSLDKICALRPVEFDWRDADKGPRTEGFIAQEFAEVFPKAVTKTDDGLGNELPEDGEPWQMSKDFLVVHLVKAIQEQQKMIEQLKTKIDELAS